MSEERKDLNVEFSDYELPIISKFGDELNLLNVTPPIIKNVVNLSGNESNIDIMISVVDDVRTIKIDYTSKPRNYTLKGDVNNPAELENLLNIIKLIF
jgi:hypothetical protein